MTEQTHMADHCYYAITGRIFGDDEDALFVYGPCTKDRAIEAFKADMLELADLDEEQLQGCRRDMAIGPDDFPGYVNTIVKSDSPITEA